MKKLRISKDLGLTMFRILYPLLFILLPGGKEGAGKG
jgi:hypothetical protein